MQNPNPGLNGGDSTLNRLATSARNNFAPFVNRHIGKRAFIVGNGPSLNKIDMGLIKDEITFGSNRVYLGFEQWGYDFTYWACQDELQIIQGADYYNSELPENMVKFVPQEHRALFTTANTYGLNILWRTEGYPKFSTSPNIFYEGWTVTYLLLQLAYLMGCNPIYLVGVDYSYKIGDTEKRGGKWGDSESSSHFIDNYMADDKGVVWNVPDFKMTDLAYACAAETLRSKNVQVFNATPGTKLNSFQKVDFETVFADIPTRNNQFAYKQKTALIVALSENETDLLRAQNACPTEYRQKLLVALGKRAPNDTEVEFYDEGSEKISTRILDAARDVDKVFLSVSYRAERDQAYQAEVAAIASGLPSGKSAIMIGDKRPADTLEEAISISNREWVA